MNRLSSVLVCVFCFSIVLLGSSAFCATPHVFSSVSDMKSNSLGSGEYAITQNYYNSVDGGGASYVVVTSGAYSGTPNGYDDHVLANGNIAVLQHAREGIVDVKTFGVKGDDTNETSRIIAAVNTRRSVYFPPGEYRLTSGVPVWSGQHLFGAGTPQRSNHNSGNIAVLKFDSNVWGINTATNIAHGVHVSNLVLEYTGVSSSTKGAFKAGIKGVTSGGYSQGLKCKLVDVQARGPWSVGFGVYGWSWTTTFERCAADQVKDIGFDVDRAANVVSFYDCEAILGHGEGGDGVGWSIHECFNVGLYTPRVENQTVGIKSTGGAVVCIVNPYMENNRNIDFVIKDPGTSVTIDSAFVAHQNNGVTTVAVFDVRDTDLTSNLVVNGMQLVVTKGLSGSDNDLTQMYHGVADCNAVLNNIAWDAVGLPFSGSYAPVELSFTNLPYVSFKRRGSSMPQSMIAIGQDSTGATPSDSLFTLTDYDGGTQVLKYNGSRIYNNYLANNVSFYWWHSSSWHSSLR